MTQRHYLDWNATAPLRPQAREAVLAALDAVGNPSSVHAEGRIARRLVEEARERVAALVGADPRNVIFTSGGTEANCIALTPHIQRGTETAPRDRLLVSAIEHPSVRGGGQFAQETIEEIPVTPSGIVELDALRLVLDERPGRPLVSVMLANNETGVIQPVPDVADIVHAVGGLLHVDAVQAAGRIPCDINALGADLLSISGHKIGATKGVGALIRASESLHLTHPPMRGGGQERGLRAGTENVAGIAGFGAAALAAAGGFEREAVAAAALRDRLESGLRTVSNATEIFGARESRLPNTVLFAHPGLRAETALIGLDLAGIAASSGAACSSGKVTASHVLAAMAVPAELAAGAIRVSFGWSSTENDVEALVEAWSKLISRLSSVRKRGFAA